MQNSTDQIIRGMLFLAVLATLEAQEDYAASILIKLGDTPFATKAGTLYPLMARMQKNGLIESRWVIKKAKPPMRYYSMTRAGRETLERQRAVMADINKVVGA